MIPLQDDALSNLTITGKLLEEIMEVHHGVAYGDNVKQLTYCLLLACQQQQTTIYATINLPTNQLTAPGSAMPLEH